MRSSPRCSQSRSAISCTELDQYAQRKGIGFFSCTLSFYGAAAGQRRELGIRKGEIFRHSRSEIRGRRIVQAPANSRAARESAISRSSASRACRMFSIGARSETNPTPGNGHVWFSPIIPRTGEAIFEANRVFTEAAKELELARSDLQLAHVLLGKRIHLPLRFPDHARYRNEQEKPRVVQAPGADCGEHGWGEYRTAPAHQGSVMDTYSFNNHALLRFHETVKEAVDPNGILSAGRYGIWPKHLRENKA